MPQRSSTASMAQHPQEMSTTQRSTDASMTQRSSEMSLVQRSTAESVTKRWVAFLSRLRLPRLVASMTTMEPSVLVRDSVSATRAAAS